MAIQSKVIFIFFYGFLCLGLGIGLIYFLPNWTPFEISLVACISYLFMLFLHEALLNSNLQKMSVNLAAIHAEQKILVQKITSFQLNQNKVLEELELKMHEFLQHQLDSYFHGKEIEAPSEQRSIIPESKALTDTSAHQLSREELLGEIHHALKQDKIEMLLQPIVSLPQRKNRYIECFSRIHSHNNYILIPDQYLQIAEEESLIRIIDNTLLFKCINLLRKSQKKDLNLGFFCNVSLKTLEDSDFLQGLVEFIELNQNLAQNLTFELDAACLTESPDHTLKTIKQLSKFGCQFSLEHLKSLDLDFDQLYAHQIRFLKIDQNILASYVKNHSLDAIRAFKKKAYSKYVDLIVSKIETENDLAQVTDMECDYGQGYLFGMPTLKIN
ncbi:EAL domain-containing protein [Candidatus Nucleicultrix amoebiphila]|uniref:EAL domain-containing protein n=1 Tax=Candidatus Nucleicultrix amoebiphila TaxID=1509244 RepID=UPI000A270132|nr:EAL domain-containing protein [Candidatus Nucleicultrix amoebiphila]